MANAILAWLSDTTLAHLMLESRWMWPVSETLHFIGLALLIGTAGVFDLRLMGFLKTMPLAAAMRMRGWAAAGILINVVTGILFFIAAPNQYLPNPAWWGKLAFLAVAIGNIVWFETRQGRRMLTVAAGADTPVSFKVAGAVSMLSWFAVLYFGRMLPFIGNAF